MPRFISKSLLSVAIAIALAASENGAIADAFTTRSSTTSPKLHQPTTTNGKRTPLQGISRGGALHKKPIVTSRFAWPTARDPKGVSMDYPLTITRMVITVAACYLTWFAQSQYSNVMASAALTLICSMVFDKRLGQAAFCGSFAGMCSQSILPTPKLALILGGVTSLLYEILIHSYNAFLGVGGRLGATAFLATSLVTYKTGIKTGLARYGVAGGSRALKLSALNWESTILPMTIWHAVGAVATIILREVSDDSAAADPVRASAVVGLAGALFLKDPTAALAVYGGSFVGMALPSKLMSLNSMDLSARKFSLSNVFSLLLSFALSGAIGGIVHGATLDWKLWMGGWGGKAGMCAFIGCLTYRGITSLLRLVVRR